MKIFSQSNGDRKEKKKMRNKQRPIKSTNYMGQLHKKMIQLQSNYVSNDISN